MTNPIGEPAMVRIDHQEATRSTAMHLAQRFAGVYGVETIQRGLHSSYQEIGNAATVSSFVPLLAERFTRQRLTGLAQANRLGRNGVPLSASSAGSALSDWSPGGAGTSPGGLVE